MKRIFSVSALALLALLVPAAHLGASGAPGSPPPEAPLPPPPVKDVGFDQRLGEAIPLDLVFRDEAGESVRLSTFFGKRPVVLSLVYFTCPMLCGMTTDGLVRSVRALSFEPGTDYEILSLSFDPRDTPETASEKKRTVMAQYGRKSGPGGWHFLTGDAASIAALTKAVGFRYVWDAEQKQFAHATGVTVLTPQGRIAKVFFGIEYPAKDLRLALIEASDEKIGNVVDQLLLLCFHYDPKAGRYTATVRNLVRAGGVITFVLLAGFVTIMLRKERARSRRAPR
ncbi:MAG TPA: SCO family protein [Thermoanaerobaculia bacterium]|nr:SCO family protein [Thermoanaerobaculia bacterium]